MIITRLKAREKSLKRIERKATVTHSRAAVEELVIVSKMLKPKAGSKMTERTHSQQNCPSKLKMAKIRCPNNAD